MLLSNFEKTYNQVNGWYGPQEMSNGKLKMMRHRDKPLGIVGKRGSRFKSTQYFKFFICPKCNEGAITTMHGSTSPKPESCGYGGCYRPPVRKRAGSIINMHIHGSGYWCYRIRQKDKNGDYIRVNSGYREQIIWFHREIAEGYLDRPLFDWEKVHHVDMDKLNNDWDNLWVCNTKQHMFAHQSFNACCAEMLKRPVQIGFNKETGKYYLKEKENADA